jgi:hypothetical protein
MAVAHLKDMIHKIFILISLALVVVGCSSTSGSAKPGSPTTASANSEAKMEKCAMCGNEFPASELVTHEGKHVCKECKAAHGG